jgi:hypothetical protein
MTAASCCASRDVCSGRVIVAGITFFLLDLLIMAGGFRALRHPLPRVMGCPLCDGEDIERGVIS